MKFYMEEKRMTESTEVQTGVPSLDRVSGPPSGSLGKIQ